MNGQKIHCQYRLLKSNVLQQCNEHVHAPQRQLTRGDLAALMKFSEAPI